MANVPLKPRLPQLMASSSEGLLQKRGRMVSLRIQSPPCTPLVSQKRRTLPDLMLKPPTTAAVQRAMASLHAAHSTSPKARRKGRHEAVVAACYSSSKTGSFAGREKPNNQDSHVICCLELPNNPYLFIVCDGHGDNGHLVSAYVTRLLPCFLMHEMEARGGKVTLQEALAKAYQKTNESMKEEGIAAQHSGSTCVTSIVWGGALVCGNVGDSRAVLGRAGKGAVTSCAVSADHKPSSPLEMERIVAAGGKVEASGSSCPRVWSVEGDLPGLAVSRALGDFRYSSLGVTAVPDITTTELTDSDLFLILASDGVWEYITDQEAVELVYQKSIHGQQSLAAQALVATANERWTARNKRTDDITAVICFFG